MAPCQLAMWLLTSAIALLASRVLLVSGHYVFTMLLYIHENTNSYQPTLASDILSKVFRCNQGLMDSAANTKVYTITPGMKIREGVCNDISDGLEDEDWCTWDKDTVSFNIPSDMPAGQYLVRVKPIGLHRAFSGNAEFYFTCAQIEITGSGAGSPTEVAQILGIYNPDDANINLNIYYPVPTSYDLPGPVIWVEGSTNDAVTSTPVKVVAPSTAVESSSSTALSLSSPSPPNTFATYFQCGGLNWTESGSCESGTACKERNPY
ncbi:glycosyl hydrolase family 61-domain-containing protein [Aspergillus cavernicola]|uniref:AA9 family lytic polysaccharide monooxygenase n=1 Tax=Aspergillus cavernicola TaxID=176166 RepID=A0ABR4HE45_9EURO